jgi:predicted small lipoprotein YifL
MAGRLITLMLILGLAGCGQKGPLYYPETPQPDADTQTEQQEESE